MGDLACPATSTRRRGNWPMRSQGRGGGRAGGRLPRTRVRSPSQAVRDDASGCCLSSRERRARPPRR
eukprot:7134132-Pyramimonas_sp.AAC.1